jgi:hypothetical protein
MNDEMNEELIERKAKECVEYIIFCYLSQHKVTIRKVDLNKHVIKDHSRLFRSIFELVTKYMNDVFGLILVPLDGADKYGIQNKFQFDSDLIMRRTEARENSDSISSLAETDTEFQEQFKYSMLMISLSLIFMNDNELDSALFWQALNKLGIKKDEKRHKYLGDVNKYFTTDLVKENYLEHEQLKGIDPPTFKFRWGQRAKLEIKKMSVLEFVCEIYGGPNTCKPTEWTAQFAEAQREDEVGHSEEMSVDTPEVEQNQENEEQDTRGHRRSNAPTQPTQSTRSSRR